MQMKIGGFRDVFFIKVVNGTESNLAFNISYDCSSIIFIYSSCGAKLTSTENRMANKSYLSLRFFISKNRDSN